MNIEKELYLFKDDKYRDFQTKICSSKYKMIGVKIPILRNIAKKLIKQYNYKDLLNNLDNSIYETVMLQGLIIGRINVNLDTKIKLINNYLPKIDNWAICDIFVSELKFIKNNQLEVLNYLKKLLKNKEEYYLRFVIVSLLTYYINDKYYEEVLNILINIKSEYYYVKMALAWAYSICLIKYFDETLKFLTNNKNNIDKWTYNKSLQKGRESFKLSKEQKEILKNLKID